MFIKDIIVFYQVITKTPNAATNLICVNSIQVYFDGLIVSVDDLHASEQNFSHFGMLLG